MLEGMTGSTREVKKLVITETKTDKGTDIKMECDDSELLKSFAEIISRTLDNAIPGYKKEKHERT